MRLPDPDDVAPVPEEVIDLLPELLAAPARRFSHSYERDIFITTALPICAGCALNVQLRYGGIPQFLNLYTVTLAPAGAGKGRPARLARQLGEPLNQRLENKYKKELARWKEVRETPGPTPEPPAHVRLFVAGDVSGPALKKALDDAPHLVICETEIATLTEALGGSYGGFRNVLRKGFHNETIAAERKSVSSHYIPDPAPGMALSGTPGAFTELIGGLEDGLFSRIAPYLHVRESPFRSQFGTEVDRDLERTLHRGGNRLNELYSRMRERDEPATIHFPEETRDVVNTALGKLDQRFRETQVPQPLRANLKRAGLATVRLAGLFRILRLLDEKKDLIPDGHPIRPRQPDIEAALLLAGTYLHHAVLVGSSLADEGARATSNEQQRTFLRRLPSGEFSTDTAEEIAEDVGVGPRTGRRWLQNFVEEDVLDDVRHGVYRKRSTEKESALPVLPILRDLLQAPAGGP